MLSSAQPLPHKITSPARVHYNGSFLLVGGYNNDAEEHDNPNMKEIYQYNAQGPDSIGKKLA